MTVAPLRVFVSVPVAGFRVAYAREYWETYPCPPPSTVYGMLLSAVGERDRLVHRGAEIAVAMLSKPARSVVLRRVWRVKDKKRGPGLGANVRPDFQELLTGVRLCVWVRKGGSADGRCGVPLVERLRRALRQPAEVKRFGGLALGESTHLVDEIRSWRAEDPGRGLLLVGAEVGSLTLPVWADHVGAKGTRWGQFNLTENDPLPNSPCKSAWISIEPPSQE